VAQSAPAENNQLPQSIINQYIIKQKQAQSAENGPRKIIIRVFFLASNNSLYLKLSKKCLNVFYIILLLYYY